MATNSVVANAPINDVGLQRHTMSGVEVISQSIANIGPTAVIAFTIAGMYAGGAGLGTFYAFALATFIILCVGYCITSFSRHYATAGSLYTYVAISWGPTAAYFTAIAMMVGSWGIIGDALPGVVLYWGIVLHDFGLPTGVPTNIILEIAFCGLAVWLTVRGVRLSARISFVLELISISIILIMLIIALVMSGHQAWDPEQFTSPHISMHNVIAGAVLGVQGFVGFGTSDALGREARNPYKWVPRAIMWSAAGVGIIYLFSTYSIIAILGADGMSKTASPLEAVVAQIGAPDWFKLLLSFCVGASFLALVISASNVASRIMYVMGKERIISRYFGSAHEEHQTPARALIFGGAVVSAYNIVLYLFGASLTNVTIWTSTYVAYGFIVAYVILSVGVIRHRHTLGRKGPLIWICSIVMGLGSLYIFFVSVVPLPTLPFRIVLYVTIATFLVAWIWYAAVARRDPGAIRQIGSEEVEAVTDLA